VLHRGPGWVTLADPTGFAYCLIDRDPDVAPPAV
jgi:hypothetical protein